MQIVQMWSPSLSPLHYVQQKLMFSFQTALRPDRDTFVLEKKHL